GEGGGADTKRRAAATAGFLKLVDALAGGFAEGTPDEARRRAMVAALTLIGALTVSRVVTDQALSDAILPNAGDSITGSQTTGGKKAKTNRRPRKMRGRGGPSKTG